MVPLDALAAAGNAMGPNVLRQAGIVAPELFAHDYIVAKLVPIENPDPSSLVVPLEPLVVASTHALYRLGDRAPVADMLADLTSAGYNVVISPQAVRDPNRGVCEEILGEGPHDRMVAAEIGRGTGFGEPRIFYENRSILPGGRMLSGYLTKEQTGEALSFMHTHFVFLRQGAQPRRPRFIEKGWELKY